MKNNIIYEEHQAFNNVYEEIENNSEVNSHNFEAAKLYHHAPDKLNEFQDYKAYLKWLDVLYLAAQKLSKELDRLYNKLINQEWPWYNCKSKNEINGIISELNELEPVINNLRNDIREYQSCV